MCQSSLQCNSNLGDIQDCLNFNCVKRPYFGLGANGTLSSQSPGSIGFLCIPLIFGTGILLYSAKGLLSILQERGNVFQFNIAGRAYIFSWVSLIFTYTTSICSIVLAFSREILFAVFILDNLSVAFLLCAMLSVEAAFIRFAVVRIMRNIPFYKQKMTYFIFLVFILQVLIFYFVDWRVYSIVSFILLSLIGYIGAFVPAYLYYRSLKTNRHIKKLDIIFAIFSEYLFRNNAFSYSLEGLYWLREDIDDSLLNDRVALRKKVAASELPKLILL